MLVVQLRLVALAVIVAAGVAGPVPAMAQATSEAQSRAAEMAQQVDTLMAEMETRAADFPAVLEQLRQGQVNIQQADERVAKLISDLTAMTDAMEDGSEFDMSVKAYIAETEALIATGTASPNQAIRDMVPALETTLTGIKENDGSRSEIVQDARNVIRELETNREAIAFAMKANQVEVAADLIAKSVGEFGDLVTKSKALADSLEAQTVN